MNQSQKAGEPVRVPNTDIVLVAPNSIYEGKDFYISHNDRDIKSYGSETTALVVGQMQKFFILRGDHRTQYAPLLDQGIDACLAYYKSLPDQQHPYSDALPE